MGLDLHEGKTTRIRNVNKVAHAKKKYIHIYSKQLVCVEAVIMV